MTSTSARKMLGMLNGSLVKWLTFLVLLAGIVASFVKVQGQVATNQRDINRLRQEAARVDVVEVQYRELIRRLDRIESKLDDR